MENEVTPALPPGCASVSDLPGAVCIARVRTDAARDVVRHLVDVEVGFYFPQQRVERRYRGTGMKAWTRAFLPGFVFVANGQDGKDALCDYAEFFDGRFYGFVGLLDHPATQAQLRRELVTVETLLRNDPTLSGHDGIVRGVAVRVTSGAYVGLEGYVEDLAKQAKFWVRLPIMGASIPVQIPVELLERIE